MALQFRPPPMTLRRWKRRLTAKTARRSQLHSRPRPAALRRDGGEKQSEEDWGISRQSFSPSRQAGWSRGDSRSNRKVVLRSLLKSHAAVQDTIHDLKARVDRCSNTRRMKTRGVNHERVPSATSARVSKPHGGEKTAHRPYVPPVARSCTERS